MQAFRLTIAATALFALAGCASGPDPDTFGGKLAMEGGAVASIGEDWTDAEERIEQGRALIEDGNDRIEDGEKQIAKGRKAMSRGNDEIAKGQKMIAEGQSAKFEAEATYRDVIAASATTVVPR